MAASTPRMHGRTHVPGGPDPIPGLGGGGIEFDQSNVGGSLDIATDTGAISIISQTDATVTAGDDLFLDATGDLNGHADVDIDLQANGVVSLRADGNVRLVAGGDLLIPGVPVTDPAVANAVWSDGGTLVMSGSTAGGSPPVDISGKVDRDAVEAATARLVQVKLAAGDTQPAFKIQGNGVHLWGPGGTTAPDTNLYRTAGGAVLKTDNDVTSAKNMGAWAGDAKQTVIGDAYGKPGITFGPDYGTWLNLDSPGVLKTGATVQAGGELASKVGAAQQITLGSDGRIYFSNAFDVFLYRPSAGKLAVYGSLDVGFTIGGRTLDVGAPDSGGAGYRMVRVAN